MTERDLERAVVELANRLGYLAAHFGAAIVRGRHVTPVRYDAKGYPDLHLVGNGRSVFVELKVGRGQMRPDQIRWMEALRAAGCETYRLTDRDWANGRVEAILREAPAVAGASECVCGRKAA